MIESPTDNQVADARSARRDLRRHELTLTFDELVLVYKSLQAVKTLGAVPPEDELLDDTIEVVDQALDIAVRQAG